MGLAKGLDLAQEKDWVALAKDLVAQERGLDLVAQERGLDLVALGTGWAMVRD